MNQIKSTIVPFCLVVLSGIAVTAALYFMRPVLLPFVFSLFVFFISAPMVEFFKTRLYIPRSLSIALVFAVLIFLIFLFVMVLGVSLKGFIQSGDVYQLKLLNLVDRFSLFVKSYGFQMDLSIIRNAILELPILTWFQQVSGGVVSLVGNLLLVLIFTFFLVVGYQPENRGLLLDSEIQHRITRYVTTKFFTSSLTGILVGIVFWLLNVQLALMFAVLTVLLNFIPSIGSIIAVLLPLPVVFLQYGYSWVFLVSIIIPLVIQMGIGNILDPKLMGERLGLHPVIILLSLLFWGFIWGVPGMFLSAPITSIVKLICSRYRVTQPVVSILEGRF